MNRTIVFVVALVLSTGCSSGPTAKSASNSSTTAGIEMSDATAVVRVAAKRSLESDGARLQESMSVKSAVVAVMGGYADFRNHTVRMIIFPGRKSSTYPPYETRFVAGSNYVSIDPAVQRPRALAARARWVAFKNCYVHQVPVPGWTTPPGLVLQQLDALTKEVVGAHFTGQTSNKRARVQLEVPKFACSSKPAVAVRWVVSIDSRGRVDEIKVGTPSLSQILFRLEYVVSTPRVDAPPSDQVQRLAPDDNLYSGPLSSPCCSPA